MHIGSLGDTTQDAKDVASGVLDFFKGAQSIVNSQKLFNQQLSTGQVTSTAPVASAPNYTRVALIGVAGLLGVMLVMRLMRK